MNEVNRIGQDVDHAGPEGTEQAINAHFGLKSDCRNASDGCFTDELQCGVIKACVGQQQIETAVRNEAASVLNRFGRCHTSTERFVECVAQIGHERRVTAEYQNLG